MPRMGAEVYAAHISNVLKLAQREGGISRKQIADELSVSYPFAGKLIEECGLEVSHKDGRTEFYTAASGASKKSKKSAEEEPEKEEKPAEKPEKAETPKEETEEKPELPAAAKAAAVPAEESAPVDETEEESEDENDSSDDSLADLDAEILETRNELRAVAERAGKALGEWAMNQALVDALHSRLAKLAEKRMGAS